MKSYHLLWLLCCLSFMACTEKEDFGEPGVDCPDTIAPNVHLLQVDYETLTFEGGASFLSQEARYDLSIPLDSFPAEVIHHPAGDFGDLTVRLIGGAGSRDTLFFGTIVWAGTGDRVLPATLLPVEAFSTTDSPSELSVPLFDLNPYAAPDSLVTGEDIFQAVDHLAIVQSAQARPNTRFGWFFYPRSVGVGDPREWDYYFVVLTTPVVCL